MNADPHFADRQVAQNVILPAQMKIIDLAVKHLLHPIQVAFDGPNRSFNIGLQALKFTPFEVLLPLLCQMQ